MRYLGLIFAFISVAVHAKDCFYSEVLAMQSHPDKVLVLLENNSGTVWKKIAPQDSPFASSYQSLAQQAFATGQNVMLRYSDGYDCYRTDYDEVPEAFRVYKY
ncbi:hypothetical protein [Saccharospirillum sp. MSK14-1]|uniref:hypothetical protein n=1 Tax=Saccharospirillum sp. MSK14-1 TaxID=1897632 RepID=UPI0011B29E1D|nr:hypothetical protein [Saccharospirillum sp. MSK14-1]